VSSAPTKSDQNTGYLLQLSETTGFELVASDSTVPEPGPDDVLVRIEAASLNYRDILVGWTLAQGPRPTLTPLSDAAGMVEAVGAGVSRWRAGDKVIPSFFREWLDGRFRASYEGSARGGGMVDGVLTRYVLVKSSELVAMPEGLSFEQASTLPCAGVTAWHALMGRGSLTAGDTVLVLGTGGVALFGLQIATAAGARVIVTSSSDEKLARAKSLGAWETVNYATHPDWEEEVLRLTDGEGVHHLLETGGQGTFDRSLKAIGAGGAIAQIGGLAGWGPQSNILRLQMINASINGINVGSAVHLDALAKFVSDHAITPVVDRVYDFEEASAAYADLPTGKHFGKLVIRLS